MLLRRISVSMSLVVSLVLILLFYPASSTSFAQATRSDILDVIVEGVKHYDSLICNIEFDYVIDYDVSEAYRNKRIADNEDRYRELFELGFRDPTLEHTIRSGTARYEGVRFYLSSKTIACSDQKVFQDKVVAYDASKVTVLDMLRSCGEISNELGPVTSDIFSNPRNYPVLFADVRALQSALTAEDTVSSVVGEEEIDGTFCHIVDMYRECGAAGLKKTVKRRCWIAPENGFLVKKAIAFSVREADRPLSVTHCEFKEIGEGIWYYSNVAFESYPGVLPEPDVVVAVSFSNIVLNQPMQEDAFQADLTKVRLVDDLVANVTYESVPAVPSLEDLSPKAGQ